MAAAGMASVTAGMASVTAGALFHTGFLRICQGWARFVLGSWSELAGSEGSRADPRHAMQGRSWQIAITRGHSTAFLLLFADLFSSRKGKKKEEKHNEDEKEEEEDDEEEGQEPNKHPAPGQEPNTLSQGREQLCPTAPAQSSESPLPPQLWAQNRSSVCSGGCCFSSPFPHKHFGGVGRRKSFAVRHGERRDGE